MGTRKLDPLKEVGMKGDERRRKKKGSPRWDFKRS
jgi:hypothetical protein